MPGFITLANFKRFVVQSHNKVAVIGKGGERVEYTLYAGDIIPGDLLELLDVKEGLATIKDGEGGVLDIVLEQGGHITSVSAARFIPIASLKDDGPGYDVEP